jgi:hypothetical protein
MDFMPESLALRFLIAFLVVLALIGIAAWVLRRFGSGRLGTSNSRGRQPRLAVIDYASVDQRRRLILVRRDNVEHLLMTGGPTDVVVESNIVRAVAAPREPALPRDITAARQPAPERQIAPEPLPRAIPPESGSSWPLAPEPATAASPPPLPAMPPMPSAPPRLAPKVGPVAEEPTQWPLQPHAEAPPARPARDTLAALADELSVRPAPRPRTVAPPRGPAIEPRAEARAEPRMPVLPAAATPEAEPEDAASADQNLAEMAQRLEAALRKPTPPTEGRAAPPTPPLPRSPRPAEQAAAPPPGMAAFPPAAPPAEPKPPAEAKPANLYDNLEQEMASLLGRPTNKN